MWPFRTKPAQRRLDARKSAPTLMGTLGRQFTNAGGIQVIILALILYAGALPLDLWPRNPLPYRLGQYVPQDIYARVKVRIPSDELMRAEKMRIEETTPAIFRLDDQFVADTINSLKTLPERLSSATQPAELPEATTRQFAIGDDRDLELWRNTTQPAMQQQYEAAVSQLIEQLPRKAIVKDEARRAQYSRKAGTVLLATPSGQVTRDLEKLIAVSEAAPVAANLAQVFPADIRPKVETYLRQVLTSQPLYVYDEEASHSDVQQKLDDLARNPPEKVYKVIPAGELLVQASRRPGPGGQELVGLKESELDLLRREHQELLRNQRTNNPWQFRLQVVARAGIILLVVLLPSLYIFRYRSDIIRSFTRAMPVALLLLGMLCVNKVLVVLPSLNPFLAILAVTMAVIVLAIAYDQRFARAMGMFLAVLVTLQLRSGFLLFVVLIIAVSVCAFQLREIRTRSKLIRVSFVTAAIVFVAVWATGFGAGVPWPFVLKNSLWAAGPAVLAGVLVQGILPLIERAFATATSLTLLEWCDASKPLLKRLAMEAPGTYNHPLQLGSICEAAAEAIGARGLLARVGAYYHDIGKINKPDYFIENQQGTLSRHAKLSPAMSLLIITAHVKDGLEMAREYSLPEILHEFIATHHGTTLVQYFYQAAADKRRADAEKAPDEVEFRYPGPRPRSKEAGILMLADASETSVRAMGDPTPTRIENQVHAMISRRMTDGQLDDCELTLRQVHQIESSIIKSLCSIYHSRISYPTPAGQKPSAGETRPLKNNSQPAAAQQNQVAAELPAESDPPDDA